MTKVTVNDDGTLQQEETSLMDDVLNVGLAPLKLMSGSDKEYIDAKTVGAGMLISNAATAVGVAWQKENIPFLKSL